MTFRAFIRRLCCAAMGHGFLEYSHGWRRHRLYLRSWRCTNCGASGKCSGLRRKGTTTTK